MKKRIKLRDLTKEQWDNCNSDICSTIRCENCMFYKVYCGTTLEKKSWFNNKDLYSDKFLDQEIEIEVPDSLDEVEKQYLSNVIKPFRNRAVSISKKIINFENKENKIFYYIRIKIESKTGIFCNEFISLPYFNNEMYEGMEVNKEYTLEDLGL